MRIVTSVATMQRLAKEWNRRGVPVGLVPTMGCLHEGHVSLVREARQRIGKRGVVVVSIYVNPTQFAPTEDLANYPRDLPRDKRLCRNAGVDVVFVPGDQQMYLAQQGAKFSTYVVEEILSRGMEGVSRPTHFRGVATVVAKLFNIVRPDVAVFGAKDFQQARQTVRTSTEPIPASRLNSELKWLIETRPAARVDYIEFFDPDTFQPIVKVQRGAHIALAVFVGKTRLIDNGKL